VDLILSVRTYTITSEAGGVGKTTLAANLAHAHTNHGCNVLAIDLDPQQASLTHLLDISAPRNDSNADNIARHLIDKPQGSFDDLIHETTYGFDVIPSHSMLESLPSLLTKAETIADDIDEEFEPNLRLRRVLQEADISNQYDTIIIDPSPTAGPRLYNAVAATGSLVIPIEPTGKGIEAVDGLRDIVSNLGNAIDLDIGVLAIVPNGVGRTTQQDDYVERIRQFGFNVPVVIRERSSLFEGCWNKQCTAFRYVAYHRDRRREYEIETLDRLRDLANSIEEAGER